MQAQGAVVIQSDYAGFYPGTLPVLVVNGLNRGFQLLNNLAEGMLSIRELLVGSLREIPVAILGDKALSGGTFF